MSLQKNWETNPDSQINLLLIEFVVIYSILQLYLKFNSAILWVYNSWIFKYYDLLHLFTFIFYPRYVKINTPLL